MRQGVCCSVALCMTIVDVVLVDLKTYIPQVDSDAIVVLVLCHHVGPVPGA
jgi:hypothetical protein